MPEVAMPKLFGLYSNFVIIMFLLTTYSTDSFRSSRWKFERKKIAEDFPPLKYRADSLTENSLIPCPQSVYPPRVDNFIEKSVIYVLTSFLAPLTNDTATKRENIFFGSSYKNFVIVSKSLLNNPNLDHVKTSIVSLLISLIPAPIRNWFRHQAKTNTKFICESSSLFMSSGLLGWLVGPVERFHIRIPAGLIHAVEAEQMSWHSGVKLKECRYLSESSCKAACLYLCRQPTHAFFNEELGLPLYMKPNFTDCSCEMFFGLAPPDPNKDDALGQSCYGNCNVRKSSPSASSKHHNKVIKKGRSSVAVGMLTEGATFPIIDVPLYDWKEGDDLGNNRLFVQNSVLATDTVVSPLRLSMTEEMRNQTSGYT